jgi:hypothetical protein
MMSAWSKTVNRLKLHMIFSVVSIEIKSYMGHWSVWNLSCWLIFIMLKSFVQCDFSGVESIAFLSNVRILELVCVAVRGGTSLTVLYQYLPSLMLYPSFSVFIYSFHLQNNVLSIKLWAQAAKYNVISRKL